MQVECLGHGEEVLVAKHDHSPHVEFEFVVVRILDEGCDRRRGLEEAIAHELQTLVVITHTLLEVDVLLLLFLVVATALRVLGDGCECHCSVAFDSDHVSGFNRYQIGLKTPDDRRPDEMRYCYACWKDRDLQWFEAKGCSGQSLGLFRDRRGQHVSASQHLFSLDHRLI